MDPGCLGVSKVSSLLYIHSGPRRPHTNDWERYTFVLLTEWAVRKAKKLVKIWECAIDVVRAAGEILQAIKDLLWKIGSFFGKLGLLILIIMELIYDRNPEEAGNDEYRMVTEGEELEDIEGAGVAGEEEDE